MYAVTVVYTAERDGWQRTTAAPTFYLDKRVQGIVSEAHARRIVTRWMADVLDVDVEFHITVTEV